MLFKMAAAPELALLFKMAACSAVKMAALVSGTPHGPAEAVVVVVAAATVTQLRIPSRAINGDGGSSLFIQWEPGRSNGSGGSNGKPLLSCEVPPRG